MIYHGTSVNECMREPVPIRTGSFLSNEKRTRSEEHTSELQSLRHLVCSLLLEKTMLSV